MINLIIIINNNKFGGINVGAHLVLYFQDNCDMFQDILYDKKVKMFLHLAG